jgi:hypothetical protein
LSNNGRYPEVRFKGSTDSRPTASLFPPQLGEHLLCPPGYEEHLKNQNAMFLLHEKKRQRELNFEYQNKSQ